MNCPYAQSLVDSFIDAKEVSYGKVEAFSQVGSERTELVYDYRGLEHDKNAKSGWIRKEWHSFKRDIESNNWEKIWDEIWASASGGKLSKIKCLDETIVILDWDSLVEKTAEDGTVTLYDAAELCLRYIIEDGGAVFLLPTEISISTISA
jgi:hypothetical protein